MQMMQDILCLHQTSCSKNSLLSTSYCNRGLLVHTDKTVVLLQPNLQKPNDNPLSKFYINGYEKCLGSILSSDCTLELEIHNHICLDSTSRDKLNDRVFQSRDLTIFTKTKAYLTITISILLHVSETWSLNRYQTKDWKLSTFESFKISLESHGRTEFHTPLY